MMKKHLIQENPFANKPISDITAEDIDELYTQKIDLDYSVSYIRKMHHLLNAAFTKAYKWKRISYNPIKYADPPAIKKEEMKIWSYDSIYKFRFHDLHHTHASILFSINVDPVRVPKRVGHANVRVTTEVYAHLFPDGLDETEIFEDALKSNQKK